MLSNKPIWFLFGVYLTQTTWAKVLAKCWVEYINNSENHCYHRNENNWGWNVKRNLMKGDKAKP